MHTALARNDMAAPSESYSWKQSSFKIEPPLSFSIQDVNKESNEKQKDDAEIDRGHWGSKWEFILSCVGLSVGIGNVWRFPYLAYSNGGGAFLIPYVILLLLVGKPMYFMEVALGQFSQVGPIAVWRMSPLFTGVGVSMIIVSLIVAIYYNIIMSYTIFYTAASLTGELPWTRCQEWWGADQFCFSRGVQDNQTNTYYDIEEKTLYYNGTRVCMASSLPSNITSSYECVNVTLQTASKQYWEKYVLGLKPDGLAVFGELGSVRWQLALCFLLSWFIVFLCVMKGVQSSGKVVYFTATFPYVILISLLIRGVTLDGAMIGIRYFFIPEWSKLLEFQVWRKAAEQMFFSLSISWGGLIMFGSYNKFRNRVDIDAFVVSSLDFATSIIAGVATFSILGAISLETGVDIKEIATAGPGFAFVTFPEAITRLPVPQLWAVLFFIMLFTLGLDSEFALVEVFLTCFYDKYPALRQRKVLLTALTCSVLLLLGIPCVTEAGTYVIDFMDSFGGGTGVLLVGVFEMIGVMWSYGVRPFSNDLRFMLGHEPNLYWKICWAFCCPVFLVAIFCFSMGTFKNPTMGPNPYPDWAIGIGWALLLVVILPVPLVALYMTFIYWRRGVTKPSEMWGPGEPHLRQDWRDSQQIDLQLKQLNDEFHLPHVTITGKTNWGFQRN